MTVPAYKIFEKPDLRKTTCYIEAVDGAESQAHCREDRLASLTA